LPPPKPPDTINTAIHRRRRVSLWEELSFQNDQNNKQKSTRTLSPKDTAAAIVKHALSQSNTTNSEPQSSSQNNPNLTLAHATTGQSSYNKGEQSSNLCEPTTNQDITFGTYQGESYSKGPNPHVS